MDNEVSFSIYTAVSLVIVSVILSILIYFITMGHNFGRESIAEIASIQAETYATELINTADHGAVPTASVFVMLHKNANAIRSISGNAYGVTIDSTDDLTQLFDKKIRLSIIERDDFYDVEVGEE